MPVRILIKNLNTERIALFRMLGMHHVMLRSYCTEFINDLEDLVMFMVVRFNATA